MAMSDFENIPETLRGRDQWLFWNASNDTPRAPLDSPAASYGCSWSDPDTWMSFEEVCEQAADIEPAGIGYVNAKDNDDHPRGIIGSIDIDGVVDEDGKPKDWLPSMQPFFDHDAYVEYSPSDTGLRVPIIGMETPDWWADSHFSAEEHEGVEVLTNKFSTYTGNQLRDSADTAAEYGEWVDEWLREVYKVINGEDPLEAESVDTDDSEYTNNDEWLTEEAAEAALDAINADVSYDTWKDIGMALANCFGTARGKSLFTQWSRGGTKWDNDAKKQAERIVNDASGYDYDAGTLVYHATNHGWDASAAAREYGSSARSDGGTTAASSGSTPATPSASSDGDLLLDPVSILKLAARDPLHPLDYDDDGGFDGSIRDIRTAERANYVWQLAKKTGDDDILAQHKGPIYAYDDGVWRDDDDQRLRQIAGQALDIGFSGGVVNELEEHVRKDRMKYPDDLGAPDGTIMCENGLLDLLRRDLSEARPDHYALAKIATEYDEAAECPRWLDFLQESIDDEAERAKFQEYAGYTLWRHSQDFGKAMFLVGPTDSGKGTAIKAIKQVLGRDNVAAESLEDLIETRWGTAQLYGNIANMRNEVTPSGLNQVQKFKELTGGEDEVSAEFKGQDKFQFVVTQKFIFSTNEVPTVQNADQAFYNRLLFVEFPNTVAPEDQDKQLLDKLADEKSGILNWMLEGLDRLLKQGQFSGERTTSGKKEICDAFGGVRDRFIHNCLMITGDEDDIVSKSDLHDLAQHYAEDIDKEPEWDKQTGFSRQMGNERGIGQGQRRIDGDNPKVFTGVRVKPEVVYRYDMDILARTSGSDEPDPTGLQNFQDDDLRPGYDTSEERNVRALIVKTIRKEVGSGGIGMSHDQLVDALIEEGIAEDVAEQKIDASLKEGRIHEPKPDYYRTT
jgi:P4 family phage/plasmid primase-like protien